MTYDIIQKTTVFPGPKLLENGKVDKKFHILNDNNNIIISNDISAINTSMEQWDT
jgi:hypothetical protein